MKFTNALSLLILSLTFTNVNAASVEPKLGLYERFCLESKIGDACGKAITKLSENIVHSEGDSTNLQERLKNVAFAGCKMNHKASCNRLQDLTVETLTADFNTSDLNAQQDAGLE